MILEAIKRKPVRGLLTALVGAGLVWQIVSVTFVAYLSEDAPRSALSLQSDDSRALIRLAALDVQKTLAGGKKRDLATSDTGASQGDALGGRDGRVSTWAFMAQKVRRGLDVGGGEKSKNPSPLLGEIDRIRISALARKALASEPLSVSALSMLGRVAILSGDNANATKYMDQATGLSLHERVAVYWMMEQSFNGREFEKCLTFGNALLRSAAGFNKYVFAIMGRIAEDKEGKVELIKLLESNPPWREQFFRAITKNVSDARTPLELLLQLKGKNNPPLVSEINPYLNFLIHRKFYELAYYTWLQFLSDDALKSAGLLANGGFEAPPSGLAFDWNVRVGAGVITDFVYRQDGKSATALYIEFTHGRVDFKRVRQMVLLGAGNYELTGFYRGQVSGTRGLRWRVVCAPKPNDSLGQSPMALGLVPKWREFKVSFEVPTTDCRAQFIELILDARSASETLVRGAIWYDDLVLRRVAQDPSTPVLPKSVLVDTPLAPVVSSPAVSVPAGQTPVVPSLGDGAVMGATPVVPKPSGSTSPFPSPSETARTLPARGGGVSVDVPLPVTSPKVSSPSRGNPTDGQ